MIMWLFPVELERKANSGGHGASERGEEPRSGILSLLFLLMLPTPSSSTKKENLLQKSNKQNAPIVKRLSVHFVFGGDCLTGMPYLDGKSGSVGVMLFEKYDNLWEI